MAVAYLQAEVCDRLSAHPVRFLAAQRNRFPQKKQNMLSALTIVPQLGQRFLAAVGCAIVTEPPGCSAGSIGAEVDGGGPAICGSIRGAGWAEFTTVGGWGGRAAWT